MEDQLVVLAEIVLAMFLGGMIGLERELANKPAGLRTHMLVGGAATMLVVLGATIVAMFSENVSPDLLRSDPIRVIEAIIVGISFLGAGTIFRRRHGEEIEGLTTAASILFTSGIGIAVGLSQFVLAIGAALLILATNRVLGLVEDRYIKNRVSPD